MDILATVVTVGVKALAITLGVVGFALNGMDVKWHLKEKSSYSKSAGIAPFTVQPEQSNVYKSKPI